MLAIALILLAADPSPVRLFTPPMQVSGVEPGVAKSWWDQVGHQLERRGMTMQTEKAGTDGSLLVAFDAVDDKRVLVHLKVVTPDNRPLASASLTAPSQDDVSGIIDVLARELAAQLRPKFEAGRIPEEYGKLKRTHAIAPGLAAGILGAFGGWALSPAQGDKTLGWALIGIGAAALALAIVILIFGDPP